MFLIVKITIYELFLVINYSVFWLYIFYLDIMFYRNVNYNTNYMVKNTTRRDRFIEIAHVMDRAWIIEQ